jgi:hypothetical protein
MCGIVACGTNSHPTSESTATTSAPELAGWDHRPDCDGRDRDDCRDHSFAACLDLVSGTTRTERVGAEVTDDDGRPLFFAAVRTFDIGSPGAGDSPAFQTIHEQGILTVGDIKAFSYTYDVTPHTNVQLSVEWGPAVRGAREATFSYDGTLISGSIDHRAFNPVPLSENPASVSFQDHGPAPKLHPKEFLEDALGHHALERLTAALTKAQASCKTVTLSDGGTEAGAGSGLVIFGDPINTDLGGHISGTYSASSCNTCKALAAAGAGLVGGALTVAACVGSLGFACGAAIVGTATGVAGAIYLCETSNACCPVACGPGTPSLCCFGDETCLNGNGLCCSAHETACQGFQCCDDATQFCMSGGCCAKENICGSNCCGIGSKCINGSLCCDTGIICGQAGTGAQSCCPQSGGCLPNGQCCADRTKICGDQCCGTNESCVNGACVATCSPGATLCAGGGTLCCGAGQECCGTQCCNTATDVCCSTASGLLCLPSSECTK